MATRKAAPTNATTEVIIEAASPSALMRHKALVGPAADVFPDRPSRLTMVGFTPWSRRGIGWTRLGTVADDLRHDPGRLCDDIAENRAMIRELAEYERAAEASRAIEARVRDALCHEGGEPLTGLTAQTAAVLNQTPAL
ncbi:hypothetical protein [Streptomyces sp. NPDC008141]|uniref:hypothetical protein n=1 Tax=Streptomyces sp. NPDC008141 TaxID=3364815 RepID=UPI0036E37850